MPFRVLIAEEHEECRQLFRRFLLRCGYEVLTAADGMGCIAKLRTGPKPDVLILSWELPWCGTGDDDSQQARYPGVDGVCEWLELARVDDIAVVVLTARMDPDSALHEQALPRITWVQRPFRLTDLLQAIQSADSISRQSWRCLENLWRKTTRPFNGILFDSAASTRDLSESGPFSAAVRPLTSIPAALPEEVGQLSGPLNF